MTDHSSSPLRGHALTLAYDRRPVVDGVDVDVRSRSFTVIVGANGSGKSTLLRGLARMLAPRSGSVLLDGRDIRSLPSKQVARRLGLLPQGPVAPDGITVADLVARGRYPHQGLLGQWSARDDAAVEAAMADTGVADLATALVDEISGGQRQRVWLAMALAQQTDVLLLDEPTTFLDIAHQLDVLDLCADLHEHHGRTLVAVLHDLNHACRYATDLVAMKNGRIVAQGDPRTVVTTDLVQEVFGVTARIIDDPETGTPLVIPYDRHARRPARGGVGNVAVRTGTA